VREAIVGDGQSFEWGALVPRVVHPLKVAIVEALLWVDEPLSAKELDLVFDEEWGLSLVAYHLRKLAALGVVEPVRQEPVRGALQTFYALPAKECTGTRLHGE
jgi:hypothetical protein